MINWFWWNVHLTDIYCPFQSNYFLSCWYLLFVTNCIVFLTMFPIYQHQENPLIYRKINKWRKLRNIMSAPSFEAGNYPSFGSQCFGGISPSHLLHIFYTFAPWNLILYLPKGKLVATRIDLFWQTVNTS